MKKVIRIGKRKINFLLSVFHKTFCGISIWICKLVNWCDCLIILTLFCKWNWQKSNFSALRIYILTPHLINSSKKVRKLEFHRSYFSYYHTSNIVFEIIRKPVYLSLNWYHICNGYEIMESTLQLVLIESQKVNLAKHCVLAIVHTHWRMKTKGVSPLGNANELQDFISDLHAYPAALYIP